MDGTLNRESFKNGNENQGIFFRKLRRITSMQFFDGHGSFDVAAVLPIL